MCALIDPLTSYLLPTFRRVGGNLACACDMCYDCNTDTIQLAVGPHDLHCLCSHCLLFAENDVPYQQALEARYPDLFKLQQIVPLTSVLEDSAEEMYYKGVVPQEYKYYLDVYPMDYTPPSTSPTNQEMHAYNGNESSWSDFIRAGARGVAGSSSEPDRFAAATLASLGLVSGGLLYTSAQNMAKPLAELRDQLFKGPSNKDMHSYNGNLFPSPSDLRYNARVGDLIDGTSNKNKRDWERHKDVEKLLPGIETIPHAHDIPGITEIGRSNRLRNKLKPAPKQDQIISNIVDNIIKNKPNAAVNPTIIRLKEELSKPLPAPHLVDESLNKLVKLHPDLIKLGPTNKEMHSYNGNIYGPARKDATKKQHRKELKRLAKKITKKSKPKKIFKKTIVKARLPKKVLKAANVESRELRIAKQYTSFLKNPVYRPPRLGSTGNNPTKLLHGYFELSFNTAAPGLNGSLTNVTDIVVWMAPKMLKFYSNASNFFGPINIGTAINATTAFTNVASTAYIDTLNFNNSEALKNEAGVPTSATLTPLARFVGGHVSIRCRCPMATTAPPFIYGGLLPTEATTVGSAVPIVDPAAQLNQLTSQQIRALPSSVEIDGFEGSSVYVPGSSVDLNFLPSTLSYSGAICPTSPIPYIGMTGCPTTANVTIIASAWFEIQQNVNNAPYGGWSLGPKVSTEDIFDNVPKIRTVSNNSLNLGVKSNTGQMSIAQMIAPQAKKPEVQLDELRLELIKLNDKIKNLSIDTTFEDEKYITMSPPDTPKYQSLSRSTIDLALQLKDKLTPGSVTSKTSRSQLP